MDHKSAVVSLLAGFECSGIDHMKLYGFDHRSVSVQLLIINGCTQCRAEHLIVSMGSRLTNGALIKGTSNRQSSWLLSGVPCICKLFGEQVA